MAIVRRWNLQALYLCMTLFIVLSSLLTPQTLNALESLPALGSSNSDHTEGLPIVIKTQKAANSIKNGIKGIDVSQYQGDINWKRVSNDGIQFAFVRASAGLATDKKFKVNAQGAHNNGILVGAYHYATFSNTAQAKKEAEYFIKLLKSIQVTYPVVLDLEDNRATRSVSKSNLTAAGLAFMDAVKQAGYKVMLYSNENFFISHIDAKTVQKKGYDLWVANYIEQPTKVTHKIWQHTSYGQVDGIGTRVDINIAYQNMSGGRKVSVNKSDSDSIKTWFNANYGTSIPIDQLDMSQIKSANITALQTELINRSGAKLNVSGTLDANTMKYFSSLSLKNGEQSNLAYIVQTALFYKGYYTGTPTGIWDSKSVNALKAYQSAEDLGDKGKLDSKTLKQLLK